MKSIENISKSDLIRLLIDNTPVAYIILDDEYRIHYINESFLKLRKLDPDKTMGEVCYNISNAGIHCEKCAVEEALRTGKKAFIARKDILPDGTVRFIDDYAIPLYKNESNGSQFILEIMVNRTQEMIAREKRDASYDEMVYILSTLLETKDMYTASHSSNVRQLAVNIANFMGLSLKEIIEISIGASLHDIGKIKIPDAIINKAGKLSNEEYDVMKKHPEYSFELLKHISSFDNIKHIARNHHERIDGKGYPDSLSDKEISLGAKIVAVADTYDAITSTRSYKDAKPHEYALEEMNRVSGTQLDADVVKAFSNMNFTLNSDIKRISDETLPKVERVLCKEIVETADSKKVKDFTCIVDEDILLKGIFDNTPCGYVLMDKGKKVFFASNYFLSYMGLTKEEVIGKICYEAGGIGASPCFNCAIDRAIQSGNVEYMRQEQYTKNGLKIFDLFGMPLKNDDGNIDFIIEIIIDRTEEVQAERRRESDFKNLIEMLGSLLSAREATNYKTSEESFTLRKRLNTLLEESKMHFI